MASWVHPWPNRPPEEDKRSVGISFVDVLFALVIARVLEPFSDVDQLSGPGVLQLVLAGVITLTSWIGYHNSLNRPTYFIRFPNLPLFQFLIDVTLVVAYWFTAVTAEHTVRTVVHGVVRYVPERPSAVPEAALIFFCFALYRAWDFVGLLVRRNSAYTRRPEEGDVPARRSVTTVCLVAAGVIFAAVLALGADTAPAVYAIDGLLIALVLVFRFLKEYVTPHHRYPSSPEESASA
jgi:uncharacterized membrane protein